MDVFKEQLVVQRPGKSTFLRLIGLSLAAAAIVAAALVMFIPMLSPLVIVGAGYGWWWLFKMQTVEYEYILTNDCVDVDQIRGRSRRKRLVSVRTGKVDTLTRYQPQTPTVGFDRVLHSHSHSKEADLWMLTYCGKKNGRTALIFEPNEEWLDAMESVLPPLLRREVQKQRENG